MADPSGTILYETVPADCANPETCIGAIMTFQPDTGASVQVDSRIVFGGGRDGLELARKGLIVETSYESIAFGIYLATIRDRRSPISVWRSSRESRRCDGHRPT